MAAINVLSLCSGGGGLDLGFSLAVGTARTVCWVEWEAFAAAHLASRMEAKQLDEAPLWSDLRTFNGKPWRGVVDCVLGGYPCQPFSLAGKRLGQDDPRHLWPHIARIVGEVQPSMCFFENVSGHLSLGFDQVAASLEAMGYQVAAGLFTAEEVGASHKRERLFILAVANSDWLSAREPETGGSDGEGVTVTASSDSMGVPYGVRIEWRGTTRLERETRSQIGHCELADTYRSGRGEQWGTETVHPKHVAIERTFPPGPTDVDAWRSVPEALWPAQSKVRLLADGLANDRARLLKLFGNGVVPLQAAYAFCALWTALRF